MDQIGLDHGLRQHRGRSLGRQRLIMRGALPKHSLARLCVVCASCVLSIDPAFAYRPFEGTDADVAKPATVEIELQPAGLLHEGSQLSLVAPATVLNFGLLPGWEAVFEGRVLSPLSASQDTAGTILVGARAFLKSVLRSGSLQGNPGPSVATEFGVLESMPRTGSGRASPASCHSAGTGEQFISTPPLLSHASIALTYLWALSLKVRARGPYDRWP